MTRYNVNVLNFLIFPLWQAPSSSATYPLDIPPGHRTRLTIRRGPITKHTQYSLANNNPHPDSPISHFPSTPSATLFLFIFLLHSQLSPRNPKPPALRKWLPTLWWAAALPPLPSPRFSLLQNPNSSPQFRFPELLPMQQLQNTLCLPTGCPVSPGRLTLMVQHQGNYR